MEVKSKVSNIEAVQNILRDMLCDFIQICRDYNLQYYTAAGTSLGAVRHQGFIPWDDDIDVYLRYDDYEKLFSIRNELEERGYEFIDYRDKGYPTPGFGKLSKLTSTIWEYQELPFVSGVYIDIFPLFEVDSAEQFEHYRQAIDKYSDRINRGRMNLPISVLKKIYGSFSVKEMASHLLSKLYSFSVDDNVRKLGAILTEAASVKGKYLAYYPQNPKPILFPKEIFDETKILLFDGIEVCVPIGVEEYLRLTYGDYMQLPPEEKRVSHHSRYFEDLERRWSIDEIIALKRELNEWD